MDRESRRKGTWSTEGGGAEFRGASDSVIKSHRPNIGLDPGRRSNWPVVLAVTVLGLGGIVGAGYYFWDQIVGAFESEDEIAGTSETGEPGPETTTQSSDEESGESGPSGPTAASGATGSETSGAEAPAGEATSAGQTDTGAPPHAWPPPGDQRFPSEGDAGSTASTGAPAASGTTAASGTPAAAGTPAASGSSTTGTQPGATSTVNLVELSITGISQSRAEANLGDLTEMVRECLSSESGPVSGELSIRMTIKWNGRSSGVNVGGEGLASSLKGCVRQKLPKARYPQPRPGKDGVIRATLKIGP